MKLYYALLQIGYCLRFRYARTSMYACVAVLSNNLFSLKPSEFLEVPLK